MIYLSKNVIKQAAPLFQSDLVGHMGTMAPGTILLLLWSALACSLAFAATRPPILDLTEELLRDIEKAQAQTARGEEVSTIFKNVTIVTATVAVLE